MECIVSREAEDHLSINTGLTLLSKRISHGKAGVLEMRSQWPIFIQQFLEDSRHEGREYSDERELVGGWTTGISLSTSGERNLSL